MDRQTLAHYTDYYLHFILWQIIGMDPILVVL